MEETKESKVVVDWYKPWPWYMLSVWSIGWVIYSIQIFFSDNDYFILGVVNITALVIQSLCLLNAIYWILRQSNFLEWYKERG